MSFLTVIQCWSILGMGRSSKQASDDGKIIAVQTKQSAPARGKGAINRQQNGLLPQAISRFHQITRQTQRNCCWTSTWIHLKWNRTDIDNDKVFLKKTTLINLEAIHSYLRSTLSQKLRNYMKRPNPIKRFNLIKGHKPV